MNYYQLFGRVFASELVFPELPTAAEGRAQWTLTQSVAPPPHHTLPRLGAEGVMPGVNVTLYGSHARVRLEYDDTGVFEITTDERKIVWHRPADSAVDMGDVRTDILGRVMAVALHLDGIPTLHGSGVALGGKGVAFLAPKSHGKSTTVAAVVRAGGALLGDDMLAVVPGSQPMVLPSIPAVNLWRDSADRLRTKPDAGDATRKQRIHWADLGARVATPVPLAAIYLLHPIRADGGAQVRRDRLPPVSATLALVGQSKIGGLLGRANAAALLEQFARLSASVPVYRLTIPREFDRLDDVVARMGEWHNTALKPASTDGPC